jgi:hypothetical protein
MDWKESLK